MLVQEGARYQVDRGHLRPRRPRNAARAGRVAARRALWRRTLAAAGRVRARPVVHRRRPRQRSAGRPEADVVSVLDGLVAKQVLGRDDDPRSPERGQYVFLQALLRTVAYGTLSRRARKERHVAAARHLEHTWPGEASDIAEVLASHYLEAIRADPERRGCGRPARFGARDADRAGRSAASLALGPEADRYFEQAAELVEDDLERAQLLEQAGRALFHSGDSALAEQRLRAGDRAPRAKRQPDRRDGRLDAGRCALSRGTPGGGEGPARTLSPGRR